MKRLIGILLALYLLTFLFGADQVNFPDIYIDESVAPGGVGSLADPYSDFSEINWTTGGDNSIFDWYAGAEDASVTINLQRGETWREQLVVGESGSATYPIIVRPYGSGALPKILGSVEKNDTEDWTNELGAEVHTSANAASDPNSNEADATTGWGVGGSAGAIASVADPSVGTYALKMTAGDANAERAELSLTVVDATVYTVSFDAKRGAQGTTQGVQTWSGVVVSPSEAITGATYDTYSYDVTTNDTTLLIRIYATSFGGEGATGDEVLIDNLSVRSSSDLWYAASATETKNLIMDSEASVAMMVAAKVDVDTQGYAWWDDPNDRIYIFSASNPATFYSGSIECAKDDRFCVITDKSYITLEYLDFRYTGNNGIVTSNTDSVSNVIIDNCTIKYTGNNLSGDAHWNGSAIYIISTLNCTLSNNTISYAFKGMEIDGEDGTLVVSIDGNTISNSIGDDGAADGMVFNAADYDGTIVENNDISTFKDDGVDCYEGENIIIQNNTIHDSTGSGEGNGIKVGMRAAQTGNQVLRNHIYNLSGGTRNHGVSFNGAASCTAAYNIVHDVAQGTRVGNLDEETDGDNDNNIIYNNVFYDCSLYGIFVGEGVDAGDKMTVTARNNICAGDSRDISNGVNTVMTGGFNCLINDAAVVNAGTYNGAADDLYTTDPLFIDAANADFRLLMASPCVDAGTDVGLTTDYRGRSIRHAPDIGAYEDPTNVLFMTRLFNYLKEKNERN